MWRMSDLMECLIFVALALMLVYTAFVTVRFFRRYSLVCRESSSLVPDFNPASRSTKNLFAELSPGVGTLRSIASAAPFLGLAGACYGMLLALFRGYSGSKASVIAAISSELSVALVATGAGLIVALTAAISHNILRARLVKFGSGRSSTLLEATPRSYGFAQTLPLRSRFSAMPAYALIAAPVLAILLQLFAAFERYQVPMGLPVRLLRVGVNNHSSAPIVVSVIGPSATGQSEAYVNQKEIPWNELGKTLQSQLKLRPDWKVYVAGEDRVAWLDVVNAIDVARGLDAEVALLTVPPTINPSKSPNEKTNRKPRAR
jgi:biopolymer transport protein ExbD